VGLFFYPGPTRGIWEHIEPLTTIEMILANVTPVAPRNCAVVKCRASPVHGGFGPRTPLKRDMGSYALAKWCSRQLTFDGHIPHADHTIPP
jgi:hypothetical protein